MRTTRIVAFQSASRTGDIRAWAVQSADNMRMTCAHICKFTETSDKKNDTQDEGEQQGPKAAGVILAVCARFAGGWKDINKDEDGRAISANIMLDDDASARINAVYGVNGACPPNFT